MRYIFGAGKHIWVWEMSFTKALTQAPADEDPGESFEHIPQDPHSTLQAHLEISPDAIGAYGKRKFGFGSQISS